MDGSGLRSTIRQRYRWRPLRRPAGLRGSAECGCASVSPVQSLRPPAVSLPLRPTAVPVRPQFPSVATDCFAVVAASAGCWTAVAVAPAPPGRFAEPGSDYPAATPPPLPSVPVRPAQVQARWFGASAHQELPEPMPQPKEALRAGSPARWPRSGAYPGLLSSYLSPLPDLLHRARPRQHARSEVSARRTAFPAAAEADESCSLLPRLNRRFRRDPPPPC